MEGWREETEEMRGGGIIPQLDRRELSLIYLHLLFYILLTSHCRSWAKYCQLSTNSTFFMSRREEHRQFNQITDRTNFSSANPCIM